MYIKAGNEFGDTDFEFMREFLEHLDVKLLEIMDNISLSPDPDSLGLFDKGEYYIGVGFTVAQSYITSTYPQLEIKKKDAMQAGPLLKNGLTFIEALNSGANFWKHREEWGLNNIVTRNIENLSKQAQKTIKTIEIVTPWSDYTCSNLLAELIGESEFELAALLPFMEEWRNDLDRKFG